MRAAIAALTSNTTDKQINMIISTIKNYSPQTIHEIVYPNNEVKEMVFAYASGIPEAPLLLYGTSGTGKSLIQRLLPNAIEKKEAQFHKVRSSDLKNASDIHDLYGRNKMFNKNFSINDQKFNYIIIEEFLMTKAAMSDAMKIELDETLGTDLTILSTNRLDEVDVGIQSRCEPLHVPPCTPQIFLPYAKKILDSVSVEYDDDTLLDGLNTVYKISQDNRKYYQWLDRVIREN
jgi:DNA polymerase III delta prime subunit